LKFRLPFLKREMVEPGTEVSLQEQVSAFWDSLRGYGFSPRTIERVWAASRCIQLNAQQIASMPLTFSGAPSASEPTWVSNPDPAFFPNGIGDAIFATVDSIYRWGDAFLYVTSRYASTGFPQLWTVLPAERMTVDLDGRGRRRYRVDETALVAGDVVQISRDPRGGLRGTSALSAYAAQMLGAISSADLNTAIMDGGAPTAVIKSTNKITADQATEIKNAWALAVASRRGTPAVLGPDLDYSPLSFSPKDLTLLELQEMNARVIASAFGVPPFMLNLPLAGGLTYQNPAMLGEFWWRFELRPTAYRVGRALTANMLPRGSSVAFDAHDTFAPLVGEEGEEQPMDQAVANASPSQNGSGVLADVRPLASIGGIA
jgi:HK97 family phage portal protein